MTEPQFGGTEGSMPPPYPPAPDYPPPGQYPPPGPYPPPDQYPGIPRPGGPVRQAPDHRRAAVGQVEGGGRATPAAGPVRHRRRRADLPRLHDLGHRPTCRRPRHMRSRRTHLGHHRRRHDPSRTKSGTRRPSRCAMAPSTGLSSRTRRYGTWATGALATGAVAYVGLVDPHRPGSFFLPCPFAADRVELPGLRGLRMTHDLLHGDPRPPSSTTFSCWLGCPSWRLG